MHFNRWVRALKPIHSGAQLAPRRIDEKINA